MPNKNSDHYFHKAAKYDLLANYYKYTRPDLHVHYYKKHLQSMEKAMSPKTRQYQPDQNAAKVRFLHGSPDGPNVDIFINDLRAFKDIPYKTLSNYLSVPAGNYQIDIYPTGEMISALLSYKLKIKSETFYTLAAAGAADNLRLATIEDNPFVPERESKVRFVHLSSDAQAVDIAAKNGDVVFRGLPFRRGTSYLGLTPMVVDFEVRAAGTSETVLELQGQQFDPDTAYTIFLVGFAGKSPELEAVRATP
ncbi:DUF4397 domain-containing protein [Bacillus sp. V59.32b]|uniref:DUF4397 domain-containing protein n=1 Tax=Bacillus sp. V59.32b TaxID=1758642 RepID=UPI000E3B74E5|nr:DUF4397 domain-containing protein [Bacillus sp. V59.32b]RFU61711.1 DUF4397 domain-containing protein [Bacillus sp. V59.32b]